MIHAKTKDTNLHIEGPDDNGHYWLYLSASGETCRIDLGVPRGMVETALLMAASVKFVRSKDDYTLAAPLQRIVEGAKTAPKWDTQADRIAALPARGVGVKPWPQEEIAPGVYADVDPESLAALAPTDAAQAREAAMQELIDAYEDIIDYGPLVLAKKDQWERVEAAKEKLGKKRA